MSYNVIRRETFNAIGACVAFLAMFGCAGPTEDVVEQESTATNGAMLVGEPAPDTKVDLLTFRNGTGTGAGYTSPYFGAQIRVANLAYDKYVAIAGTTGFGAPWQEYPATWIESYPDGTELWAAHGNVNLSQFAVKYSAAGQTYWDNNSGADYHAQSGWDFFYGSNVAIWPDSAYVEGTGQVRLRMVVKNIAYTKLVSARYTLDAWAHYGEVAGTYLHYFPGRSYEGSQEYWELSLPTVTNGSGARTVTFAGRYQLPTVGQEYWANQGGLNFVITCPSGSYGCSID